MSQIREELLFQPVLSKSAAKPAEVESLLDEALKVPGDARILRSLALPHSGAGASGPDRGGPGRPR
jgi:hypothetical protein